MRKNSRLYASLILLTILAVIHIFAETLSLYWTYWWFDYFMHFFGGLSLGVLVLWALDVEERSIKSFLAVFICVMIASVVWEIFEYLNDLAISQQGYKVDTAHDLVMDALGTVVAYYYTISGSLKST